MARPRVGWLELEVEARDEGIDWVCSQLAPLLGGRGQVALVRPTDDSTEWDCSVVVQRCYDGSSRDDLAGADIEAALVPLRRTGLVGDWGWRRVTSRPRYEPDRLLPARRVGERLRLAAPGQAGGERPGEVAIVVAPSLAFGSGWHPATVATLMLLEREVRPGLEALDLGCGSGIASVALAKLGARVLALDNDPGAVRAARRAVRLNDVADRVRVRLGSLGSAAGHGDWMGRGKLGRVARVRPAGDFDLIVANIVARVHLELAEEYAAALRPGGVLIAGGFTTAEEGAVMGALEEAGLRAVGRNQGGEYVAVGCAAGRH